MFCLRTPQVLCVDTTILIVAVDLDQDRAAWKRLTMHLGRLPMDFDLVAIAIRTVLAHCNGLQVHWVNIFKLVIAKFDAEPAVGRTPAMYHKWVQKLSTKTPVPHFLAHQANLFLH